MRGLGCNCPSCGAPARVSLFVRDSLTVRSSHRCVHCGEASALAAWSVRPLGQDSPEGGRRLSRPGVRAAASGTHR